MANDVKSVAEGMADIARSGRIGRPVFVRWTETVREGGAAAQAAADAAVGHVSGWMGAAPDRQTVVGSPEAGNLTVFCIWGGGQSAIVATGIATTDDRPGLDIALIGSSGAAYHNGSTEILA